MTKFIATGIGRELDIPGRVLYHVWPGGEEVDVYVPKEKKAEATQALRGENLKLLLKAEGQEPQIQEINPAPHGRYQVVSSKNEQAFPLKGAEKKHIKIRSLPQAWANWIKST